MKFKWEVPHERITVPAEILDVTGGKPRLAEILVRRGHRDVDTVRAFLYPDHYEQAPASDLPGMRKGVSRIEEAIRQGQRILVWGDFDVDGQTSTALLYAGLKRVGAEVSYHIPVREKESHGIRPEFLQSYIDDGIDVLLSCDTGIAAHEAVDLANRSGVDVIITDHHDRPEVLPDAYAIINPKLFPCKHPLSNLPGVGVAYKFIEALYERVHLAHEARSFLDLVALGIVADLAIVTEDTRYLLQLGLGALRKTSRHGLLHLMDLAKVDPEQLIEEHIGFQIGPRLNAVGRLADANVSVPLLTTDDSNEAREIAERLERLNEDRRFRTELVYASAVDLLEKDPSLLRYAALVLSHSDWHPGVIGIVASRLVEEFGKPTILISEPEGEVARGSARSIEGYHITEAIATQSELLAGFGGHPMAAGLAIDPAHIDRFRRGVSKAIIDQRTGVEIEPTLAVDASLGLGDLTFDLVDEIEMMAPFGPGNPPIHLLCSSLHVAGEVLIGRDKSHRKLIVEDRSGERRELLWWNSAEEPMPEGSVDVVVRARPGYFRGERQLTVTLQDMRPSGVRIARSEPGRMIFIRDHREEEEPLALCEELLRSERELLVWGEGEAGFPAMKPRMDVEPSPSLVIWTVPPSQEVLRDVLHVAHPETVYVIGVDPNLDRLDRFTKRLLGLIRYTLENYEGRTTLKKLSAAMAHSDATVQCALDVLPEMGLSASIQDGEVLIERTGISKSEATRSREKLQFLIAETRSYRNTFSASQNLSNFLIVE